MQLNSFNALELQMPSILSFSPDYKAVKVMNKELLHVLKELNGNTYIGNDITIKQMVFQANIEKLDNMERKLATSLRHHANRPVSIHMLTCASYQYAGLLSHVWCFFIKRPFSRGLKSKIHDCKCHQLLASLLS